MKKTTKYPRRTGRKRSMKMIVLVITAFVASGCAMGLPGQMTQKVSEFDDATEIRIEPAWACSGFGCRIRLGFYQTSRMHPNDVIMIAEVISYARVINPVFGAGESLHFKIDGRIYSFESDGYSSKEHEYSQYTGIYTTDSQQYKTTKDFLRALMNGKRVVVKVDLVGSKYVEGIFPGGGWGTVRPGLAKFYKQVFGD